MVLSGISFDLWYTLIYETEEDEAKYQEMRLNALKKGLHETGVTFNEDALNKAFIHLRKFSLTIPYGGFIKLVLSSAGIRLDGSIFRIIEARYLDEIENYRVKLGPEVPSVLEGLKERGLKIAIVSNTSFPEKSLWKVLGRAGIAQHVDAIVSSSDEGVGKPSPVIFSIAERRLNVPSGDILHVGDTCIEDYMGATAFGMKAILYTGLYGYRKEKDVHELCQINGIVSIKKLSEIEKLLESNLFD
ncbi:MAG: HAD family hydrolase [Desulfurococcales archaeon]